MAEVYRLVVLIFTVSNLAAMGLQIHPERAATALKNPRFVPLILAWGWVLGPGIAWIVTRILPLSEPHAAGLLLISMAPTAPFYPLMVMKARGDMSVAGAFILVATIGTVVFLPLEVPLLIPGLQVSAWTLAQPLLTLILLPLLAGIALRVRAPALADKLFPVVRRVGTLFLIITGALTGWLYWREMLGAVGSFAIAGQLLYLTIITVGSYQLGFGLRQGQRTALSLGMCTRNIAAVFVAYFGIANPDPGIFVMIVLVVPIALIVAAVAARVFAKKAAAAESGGRNE
jgi:BASS family bile acid:Na+ symporter